jgi:hypothetical protein
MIRLAPFILVALGLAGCSSAPKYTSDTTPNPNSQYCYTSQNISVKDGERVSSQTDLKCSDDPVERIGIKRAEMASNCHVFDYWIRKSGNVVYKNAIRCRLPNGNWHVVDPDFN